MVWHINGLLSLFLALLAFYYVDLQVHKYNKELGNTNEEIVAYIDDIHLLKMEWAHLSNPERLRQMGNKYFDLSKGKSVQVVTFNDIEYQGQQRNINGIAPVSYNSSYMGSGEYMNYYRNSYSAKSAAQSPNWCGVNGNEPC